MKKYDQLVFAALLAAFFVVLSITLSVVMPTTVEVNGKIDADLPAVQTVQPTTPPTTQPPVTVPPTTQPSDTPDNDTTTTAPTTEKADDNALPQSNEEILAKYTELMNDAKVAKPGFKKVEWQAIPEEKAKFEGKIFGTILPLASNFFKTEADAKAAPEIANKGENMEWFPIYHNEKGCLLTDASKIKSASCTEQPDGNVKITIVMNDEVNSEPPGAAATCASAVGSICTPIEMQTVRDTLQNDGAIKLVARNIDFDLTYYDCTAEIVYNPANNQLVSLDQFMHILINIKDGTVAFANAKGTAVLDNYMYISDFVY